MSMNEYILAIQNLKQNRGWQINANIIADAITKEKSLHASKMYASLSVCTLTAYQ